MNPNDLPTWERHHFRQTGGKPFLFYVVYGHFGDLPEMSRTEYRCEGIFPGLMLQHYDRAKQPDVLLRFQEGYLWDELIQRDPGLARQIQEAHHCMILNGELEDQPNLNYLRDSVGLLTYLLDNGGLTIYDPLMFTWWAPALWKKGIFEPGAAVPRHHVLILLSDEQHASASEPLRWFHTRGLRKFGRPDLSIHEVPPRYSDGVTDLCERFIEFQAFGGVIDEGMEINVKGLPDGMICRHAGDVDDPDFNNVHVEISPPRN